VYFALAESTPLTPRHATYKWRLPCGASPPSLVLVLAQAQLFTLLARLASVGANAHGDRANQHRALPAMSITTLQLLPWPPEPARAAVLPPLLLAAAAAVVVCLWALLSRRLISRERAAGGKEQAVPARLPPGSFGWPVVGETLEFVSCAYSSRPEAFVDKRRLL